jgi:hypothetical protein
MEKGSWSGKSGGRSPIKKVSHWDTWMEIQKMELRKG